jgi:DNA-binding winged helix-turn-helix (wHTH) protein
MLRLEIYPEVWDRSSEEDRENLINSIASLRELLDIVVGRGCGLMVTIT